MGSLADGAATRNPRASAIVFEYERLDTQIKGEEKDRFARLAKELAKFDAEKPALLPMCQATREVGVRPPETAMGKKAAPIDPAYLTVLGEAAPSIVTPKHQSSSGRRAVLAQLVDAKRPSTHEPRHRQSHLAAAFWRRARPPPPTIFGNLGEKPSHPELLDWLADRFVKDGWSIKKCTRLILTSKTYQQSSLAVPDAVAMPKGTPAIASCGK